MTSGNLWVRWAVEQGVPPAVWPTGRGLGVVTLVSCRKGVAMRCYGLRAALFAAALCAALLAGASLWLGLVGAAAVSALLVALGWIIYFHSERTVLAALRARPVSEVERPDLYRIVRELAFSAHLPVPRLFVSPATQPNILTVGYSARSAAVCCTEGLLRLLTLSELRAVLAHELAHVARHDVAVSSWSAGLASLVASCPPFAGGGARTPHPRPAGRAARATR